VLRHSSLDDLWYSTSATRFGLRVAVARKMAIKIERPAAARAVSRVEPAAPIYLIYVGMGGANVGVLLWPAAAQLILTILLART